MTNISNAYINALLADATYALELNGLENKTGEDLGKLLTESMTPTLAKYISDNYTVVTHIETPDTGISGFDATVWKENATGKIYISMQGTTGLADFLTDADLATIGNAREQLVTMVNWWFKISTPAGQSAPQIQLETVYDNSNPPVALGTHFVSASDVVGTGLVSTADLLQGIEVSGHSLGGYLATAFTRLFGSQAHVAHTSTFNSAGFAPGSESAFVNLQNLIGPSYGLGRFPNEAEQSNYFAANGLNVTTANSFWFSQQGQRVELYQEEGLGIANHSMYKLTDLLALDATVNAKRQLQIQSERAVKPFFASRMKRPTMAGCGGLRDWFDTHTSICHLVHYFRHAQQQDSGLAWNKEACNSVDIDSVSICAGGASGR